MRKNLLLSLLLTFLLIPVLSFADVRVSLDGTSAGSTNCLNLVRGGTTAAQSGRCYNTPIAQDGLVVAGAANGDATSLTTTTNAIPVTSAYVNMQISADPAFNAKTLADGVDGQIITLHVYSVTPSKTLTVTPSTAYGWSVATFNAVDDTLTLLFLDGSGWVVIGNISITLTP